VAFARFVNVLRQLNGLVAGATGMDWRVFVLCNAAGGALWVLAWGLGAWWLSSHVEHLGALRDWAVRAESALLPGIAILLVGAILWRRRSRGRRRGEP
jgi:membrane protein DedA with SNARE-associated domain